MDADVLVVGAGPAGSAVATHLARAGLDVLMLEKSTFPREKVCGDGLTPRAVRELLALGVDIEEPGWVRNRGVRMIGGGRTLEVDWDEVASPGFGLLRRRQDFDEILVRNAERAGAKLLQDTKVTGPLVDDRTGRVTGVAAGPATFRARLVVAADGASSRLSAAVGLHPRADRPLGVAARRYYRSPRHDDEFLEAWLDLGPAAYAWVFGVGDGTCNVGVAVLGGRQTGHRQALDRWLGGLPRDWGFTEDNATGPLRGAALPMGYNRQPHYQDGLLLVGDCGGMVNPMNGEGIGYALHAARTAAEAIVPALSPATSAGSRERLLHAYPGMLKAANGGAFTLGRWFAGAIEHPWIMRTATRQGLARPTLMRFAIRLFGHLDEPGGRDAVARLSAALARLAPSS